MYSVKWLPSPKPVYVLQCEDVSKGQKILDKKYVEESLLLNHEEFIKHVKAEKGKFVVINDVLLETARE
jgi:hypothetical protein